MSQIKQYKVTEPWLKTSCGLGEAPFWDKKSNTLRFLDIIKKQLHVVNLNEGPSSHKTIDLPFSIGCTANIEGNDDEFIFGGKDGYGIANKNTGEPRYIKKFWSDEEVQSGRAHRSRSNDGSVDSHGRFYVGTMNDPTIVGEPGPEGKMVIRHMLFQVTKSPHRRFIQTGPRPQSPQNQGTCHHSKWNVMDLGQQDHVHH